MELPTYPDERGSFSVRWNASLAQLHLQHLPARVQTNASLSDTMVLRGLHYQLPPFAQAKIVSVVHGRAFDVVVDIRRGSDRFGSWYGFELDWIRPEALWVPSGFAHGFLALEPNTVVQYDVTSEYAPSAERSIIWNDPAIGIAWPIEGGDPLVSPKDAAAPLLADAEVFD